MITSPARSTPAHLGLADPPVTCGNPACACEAVGSVGSVRAPRVRAPEGSTPGRRITHPFHLLREPVTCGNVQAANGLLLAGGAA